MNEKLQWLRNKLNSLDLQGIVLTDANNIKYLTNLEAEGTLLMTRKENIYITDARYLEEVNNTLTLLDEIIVYDVRDLNQDDFQNFFMFCENVGFEENSITYSGYKELIRKYKINNLVETENIIEKQRMIKDSKELEYLKEACEITDNCFAYILSYIKPGMTEKQIALEIEEYFKVRSDGLAFETIVATGENTSKPHAVPTERKVEKIDIITIDMGCKVKGYASDMTRTFFVGEVTKEQKYIYDIVKYNETQVDNMLKEGANTRQIAKAVENDLALNNFNLLHSIGHGVGLDVHEIPYFSTRGENILKDNMVVAIEPGIYLPGKFGVRIENTKKITKFGCINLTKSEKDYIVICKIEPNT